MFVAASLPLSGRWRPLAAATWWLAGGRGIPQQQAAIGQLLWADGIQA